MTPRYFVRLENARLYIFAIEVFVGVGWHRTVRRQITPLGTQNEFVAREALLRKLRQRRADAALTTLKTIVDGRVDHIDAALDGRHHRSSVAGVNLVIRLAKISADA